MQLAFKRAGLAVLAMGAVLGGVAAPAEAVNRSVTLTGDQSESWSGGGTGAYMAYDLLACEGTSPLDACDASHVTVVPGETPSNLTFTLTMGELDDFDLYVYPDADLDGVPDGPAIEDADDNTGNGSGAPETLSVPGAAGTYLVEIVNFLSLEGSFTATAALDTP